MAKRGFMVGVQVETLTEREGSDAVNRGAAVPEWQARRLLPPFSITILLFGAIS
jgi:hypothetical protein